ncbi:hypothetical protein DRQ53_12220 [bacterium]|nr:MAG: hypothetical protein DRQ53_12220 [bacterium]
MLSPPDRVLSKYSADSDQRVLASCGDEFGMPGCHAAAEIDGRVVANDLRTMDAHTGALGRPAPTHTG